MTAIAERSQRLVQEFLANQKNDPESPIGHGDPLNIGNTFLEMTQAMLKNPNAVMKANLDLWSNYMNLWAATTKKMLGQESEDLIAPAQDDRRFKDPTWNENALFDYIKQSYLLTARWMQSTVSQVEGLDSKTMKKVDFYTRQFADAMAPTNFVMTNPEVLRETLDSKGENLVRGLENMLSDLEKGKGKLKISMTDATAFEVGGNLATSPGQVVYQNDLIQLIQYAPSTETVAKIPLLIVPPWINKFYILDLREKNSFIRWAVSQGLTVFVVSWVNPDARLANKSFSDYMMEGPVDAIEQVLKITGEKSVNMIGYCLGGTLTAATLAYLTRKKQQDKVKSVTYFTTLIDFAEAGELEVFIDEEQLAALESKMNERGYLEGSEMATTFNMLRANDLIWSFVVNNYLMGKDPFPFDLLFWNGDSTRMPAAMHSFYLRNMYLENKLIQPNGIELAGTPIDLTTVKTPTFVLSTREDHIAPWKATYAAVNTYSGPVKFCLAGSGHIAGVVNPPNPEKPKYGYWTYSRKVKDPDAWLEKAERHEGSWWPEWRKWLGKFSGAEVPAREPGCGVVTPIEPAPGSYVKGKA
ncbi:class I poly(R)-hydroxyalkanoic acid synthase [Rhodospirillaceae bacterium KN72]|uniref:Class I poly(R)-hydroxyalkanoic acid synthase n=2 Tax=Pacificispira spongiicola TaxID=2729598 RepID=A0A7Y0E2Y1_9PROT|nr:class I poly(R)-hydroxyalkanoic acid synthase [Pacificispira spongiicola]